MLVTQYLDVLKDFAQSGKATMVVLHEFHGISAVADMEGQVTLCVCACVQESLFEFSYYFFIICMDHVFLVVFLLFVSSQSSCARVFTSSICPTVYVNACLCAGMWYVTCGMSRYVTYRHMHNNTTKLLCMWHNKVVVHVASDCVRVVIAGAQ
jgi:hypothetical protein